MTSELDFLTHNNNFQQLLEDLSIVDNLHDRFDLFHAVDDQLIDTARNVTCKQGLLHHLQQSEAQYVTDLCQFHDLILPRLYHWLEITTDAETTRFKEKSLVELNKVARLLKQVTTVHLEFLRSLDERMEMWGPTQFISDILGILVRALFFCLSLFIYIYILNSILEFSPEAKELPYYFQLPLTRIPFYLNTLHQLVEFSDSSHPDYLALNDTSLQIEAQTRAWEVRIKDCFGHLGVLESVLQVNRTPIQVTKERRLLLQSEMIKVDLDDLSLTSDRRMYFLYNDCMIYCKKSKKDTKWEYKGTLGFHSGAEVRILAASVLAKMVEVKKPLFRIGKKTSLSETESVNEAFGFEMVAVDTNIDAMSPMHQNYQIAMAGGGNPILRRHMIRASCMEEQVAWVDTLRKAIYAFNAAGSQS
ncbi:hypothetical protein K501DRAFT_257891 [Backusella circina FSU 941]|nr:hypothetical protein K501DRAFT_257891 [Backusella circina FSU 941]